VIIEKAMPCVRITIENVGLAQALEFLFMLVNLCRIRPLIFITKEAKQRAGEVFCKGDVK
jgi:hypothetical protein